MGRHRPNLSQRGIALAVALGSWGIFIGALGGGRPPAGRNALKPGRLENPIRRAPGSPWVLALPHTAPP